MSNRQQTKVDPVVSILSGVVRNPALKLSVDNSSAEDKVLTAMTDWYRLDIDRPGAGKGCLSQDIYDLTQRTGARDKMPLRIYFPRVKQGAVYIAGHGGGCCQRLLTDARPL